MTKSKKSTKITAPVAVIEQDAIETTTLATEVTEEATEISNITQDTEEAQKTTQDTEEAQKTIEEATPVKVIGKIVGARDVWGFGIDTVTSAIFAAISSGEFTRAQALDAILTQFAGSDKAKIKATKTTFGVTWSDLRQPVLKYHASRSLVIVEDSTSHKVSFDPTRAKLVQEAIAAGLLNNLKGKSMSKRQEILSAAGLPTK